MPWSESANCSDLMIAMPMFDLSSDHCSLMTFIWLAGVNCVRAKSPMSFLAPSIIAPMRAM